MSLKNLEEIYQELKQRTLIIQTSNMENLQIKPIDTTNFYNDPNAVYIKLTYVADVDGFKFEVKNELLEQYTPDTVPEEVIAITQFIRGLVTMGISWPSEMRRIGVQAMNAEIVEETDMEETHRELLRGKPRGNA